MFIRKQLQHRVPVRESSRNHVLPQARLGLCQGHRGSSGSPSQTPDSGRVGRDELCSWRHPRRLRLLRLWTLAAGRASRGLSAASASAFILCLSSLGFYTFRLINSIRS